MGWKSCKYRGDETIPVQGLAYHSGRVQPGDVFVALKGYQTDGHLYIAKAIDQGARAIVVENRPAALSRDRPGTDAGHQAGPGPYGCRLRRSSFP